MFTGLVEELGRVTAAGPGALTVSGPLVAADTRPGDSVAVDGVCLTVVGSDGGGLRFDLLAETVQRTALGDRRPGDRVNLERAVTPATRLGGHLVQGHVDGVGTVVARDGERVRIGVPAGLARYVVAKGSVCLDGVSLTVAAAGEAELTVALIPETLRRTTLGLRAPGDRVNVEVDVLAKYVEKLLGART